MLDGEVVALEVCKPDFRALLARENSRRSLDYYTSAWAQPKGRKRTEKAQRTPMKRVSG